MILRTFLEVGTALTLIARRTDLAVGGPRRFWTLSSPLGSKLPESRGEKAGSTTTDRVARPPTRLWTDTRYWAMTRSRRLRRRILLPLSRQEKELYLTLRAQNLFDEAWYLEHNPDVRISRVDPLHHLIRHGIHEGRAPSHHIASAVTAGPSAAAEEPDARGRYLSVVSSLQHSTEPAPGEAVESQQPMDKGHLSRLSDATVRRGLTRFERFPLFRTKDYLTLNDPLRDAPGLVAHRHAFTYGFSEGRAVFDRLTIANELGLRSRGASEPAARAALAAREVPALSVSILYNASGNLFLREIAQNLHDDLREAGHDVVQLDDTADPSRLREHNIIVAPHEFFFIGRGGDWISDDILRRSVMYNTEQPQTIWFDRAVPFNLVSRGVIDLSAQVASIYADCMPSIHCDPSGSAIENAVPDANNPILKVLPKAARRAGSSASPMEDRCIDVSFFGGSSQHRDRFFAGSARFFSDYRTLFYCRRADGPIVESAAIDLLSTARHVAFHSKLVLNVHRDDFGFFEWHRIVRLGIETGAVVVSEPCLPHPGLKPNVHYFEESGRHIQNLVEWLLKTEDGQAEYRKVKRAASDFVERRRTARDAGRRIARFLHGLED